MNKLLIAIILFTVSTVLIASALFFFFSFTNQFTRQIPQEVGLDGQANLPTPTPTPIPTLPPITTQKTLPNGTHTFQTFNNCGPAALSMTLSYYGISVSQQTLGQQLRPYQNPQGDNDDKSVTLEEVANKAKEYGFITYRRPNGTIEQIEQFIAHDMPVVARTWLKIDDDIGHFRVVKGYDQTTQELIQDDSLQGKDLRYSYDEFNAIWKKFNYEFLAVVPAEKQHLAEQILGPYIDEQFAWKQAVELSRQELEANPNDIDARFNLSVALYNIGEYQQSVIEFEKIESRLPSRTLWYQIEPIEAYFELGQDERVFQITDQILNNHNRAFSELYYLRGRIYQKQGNIHLARQEYEKAVFYNVNFQPAKQALEQL